MELLLPVIGCQMWGPLGLVTLWWTATFCYGKSPCLMGKSTISMAIFHCYVSSPEGMPFGMCGLALTNCSLTDKPLGFTDKRCHQNQGLDPHYHGFYTEKSPRYNMFMGWNTRKCGYCAMWLVVWFMSYMFYSCLFQKYDGENWWKLMVPVHLKPPTKGGPSVKAAKSTRLWYVQFIWATLEIHSVW